MAQNHVAIALIMLTCSSASGAKTIAATQSTLATALRSATGGDRIVLNGDFGFNKIYGASYSSLVTLDASAARLSDTVVFYNANNLLISGGTFGSSKASTRWGRDAVFYNSANVGFDQAQFVGNGGGAAVAFIGVSNAYVLNSTFSNFGLGLGLSKVNGATLTNNAVYGQTKDGFDIAGSRNVTASHNACYGANPAPGAHPDCIQIWGMAGQTTSNIALTDNLAYESSQGFTKFASGGSASHISMLRNVVESTMPQGIACYDCYNSEFRDNELVTLKSAPHLVNLNIIGGSNNILSNNSFVRNTSNAYLAPEFAAPTSFAGLLRTGLRASLPTAIASTTVKGDVGVSVEAVPEPSLWACLIAGFGLQGGMMRHRRKRATTVAA